MKNKITVPVIVDLLALSIIVISAFVPWFQWSFREGSQAWYEKTDVWGPPAVYFFETSYASVDVSINGINAVNQTAGVYLTLFLLGIALWIGLLRMLGREVERRTMLVVLGVVSIIASVGLVVIFGLGELIAQRVGLYAATRSSEIILVEIVGFQVPGPLMLIVGVVVKAAMVIWRRGASSDPKAVSK